jgi:hypothetical protein
VHESHGNLDDQTQWNALIAEAAKLAADDIRDRDDPHNRQLRAALEEIHARLTADADDARG